MKKVPLIASSIHFKRHSIVYTVSLGNVLEFKDVFKGLVCCNNDIKDKDLILKPTYLDKDNFEVIFVPINVTVEFYQKIFLDTKSKLAQEHRLEKNDIYDVGDVVGYVIV